MIRKYGILWVTILIPLALFLLVACQRNQPVMSHLQSSVQPLVQSNNNVREPASDVTPSTSVRFTEADFARHVVELKKKLPSAGFSIVIQPPFVVIGDEPLRDVQQQAQDTVKWAVDRLKQDFF